MDAAPLRHTDPQVCFLLAFQTESANCFYAFRGAYEDSHQHG